MDSDLNKSIILDKRNTEKELKRQLVVFNQHYREWPLTIGRFSQVNYELQDALEAFEPETEFTTTHPYCKQNYARHWFGFR